jgi:putative transposase
MKKSKFSDEKIAYILRQAEAGTPAIEVCRQNGISEQTFYRWKKRFAGMGVGEVRSRPEGTRRQLEEENNRLKQLVADLSLDKAMLQEVIAKKL